MPSSQGSNDGTQSPHSELDEAGLRQAFAELGADKSLAGTDDSPDQSAVGKANLPESLQLGLMYNFLVDDEPGRGRLARTVAATVDEQNIGPDKLDEVTIQNIFETDHELRTEFERYQKRMKGTAVNPATAYSVYTVAKYIGDNFDAETPAEIVGEEEMKETKNLGRLGAFLSHPERSEDLMSHIGQEMKKPGSEINESFNMDYIEANGYKDKFTQFGEKYPNIVPSNHRDVYASVQRSAAIESRLSMALRREKSEKPAGGSSEATAPSAVGGQDS